MNSFIKSSLSSFLLAVILFIGCDNDDTSLLSGTRWRSVDIDDEDGATLLRFSESRLYIYEGLNCFELVSMEYDVSKDRVITCTDEGTGGFLFFLKGDTLGIFRSYYTALYVKDSFKESDLCISEEEHLECNDGGEED